MVKGSLTFSCTIPKVPGTTPPSESVQKYIGVGVGVRVGVNVGVRVGEGVGVLVGINVGVRVGEGVGVLVGVGVFIIKKFVGSAPPVDAAHTPSEQFPEQQTPGSVPPQVDPSGIQNGIPVKVGVDAAGVAVGKAV